MKNTNGILWSRYGPRLEAIRSPMRNADTGGPLMCLKISDLNPQSEMRWALTRCEMVRVGFWFLARAFFPTSEDTQ